MIDYKEKKEIPKHWYFYWIIYGSYNAFILPFESLINWIPYFDTIKLLFFIYLTYPHLKGAEHIYKSIEPIILESEFGIVSAKFINIISLGLIRLISNPKMVTNLFNKIYTIISRLFEKHPTIKPLYCKILEKKSIFDNFIKELIAISQTELVVDPTEEQSESSEFSTHLNSSTKE